MENKAHALSAGAFQLLVGALLVALAFWLTRDTGVRRVYEMSTREAVSGLQPQAAVRYRGLDVGKVTQLGFDPQATGNVLIRIAVDDTAREWIRDPLEYTFNRPLGDFEHCGADRHPCGRTR